MTEEPEAPRTVASLLEAMVKAATMLADEPARLSRLQTFADMWGLECYTPPEGAEVDVYMIVQAMIALAVRVERERGEMAAVPQPPQEPTPEAVERAAKAAWDKAQFLNVWDPAQSVRPWPPRVPVEADEWRETIRAALLAAAAPA